MSQMPASPLVSIGLFVYNGERFIRDALDSILSQTFTDFELIISDNASTDRTGEIAQSYAQGDKRIRYYRNEKNMGAGWNVCRVYELATGKYFKQAAVDDLLEPDFLRQCVEILERDPGCVVVYAATKEIDENGAFIQNYVTPMRTDANDPAARFRDMILIPGWSYQIFGVMRMAALRRIPPMGRYVAADTVLLARMALLGRFHEIPEHLFISRHHRGQSSKTLPPRLQQPRRIRLTNRYSRKLPGLEWWDPSKARAITFPEFRLLREYFMSIYRAPLSVGQRMRCYWFFLSYIKVNFRLMMKDLLIAGDQILYNFQVPRQPPAPLFRSSLERKPGIGE